MATAPADRCNVAAALAEQAHVGAGVLVHAVEEVVAGVLRRAEHDADGLALIDRKTHIVDRGHYAVLGGEFGDQILDFDQFFHVRLR